MPVTQKKSLGRNIVKKNGGQKSPPSPSLCISCVELGKDRGTKVNIDKENTPSVLLAESPEDNNDMETNLHTVYTAPQGPEQATDPIIIPLPSMTIRFPQDTSRGARAPKQSLLPRVRNRQN